MIDESMVKDVSLESAGKETEDVKSELVDKKIKIDSGDTAGIRSTLSCVWDDVDRINKKVTIILILVVIMFVVSVIVPLVSCGYSKIHSWLTELSDEASRRIEKPVIYVYDARAGVEDASYSLSIKNKYGRFKSVSPAHSEIPYPYYDNGERRYGELIQWNFVLKKDRLVVNDNDYRYLFWDAEDDVKARVDNYGANGFCIEGKYVEMFLEDVLLNEIGMTSEEAQDFITFWAPSMKENPYNYIVFAGTVNSSENDFRDNYTSDYEIKMFENDGKGKLDPAIESTYYQMYDSSVEFNENRLLMLWEPMDKYEEIRPQVLVPFKRDGLYIVEWGGVKITE